MQQYVTYLRAEIRKLGNEGDATAFLSKGRCIELASVPVSVEGLMSAFASQRRVDEFVLDLSHTDLVAFTRCCSRWRQNNIAERLSPDQRIEVLDVHVDRILVGPAEPRLASDFARLGWRLAGIARDEHVLAQPPYRDSTRGRDVDVPICIAIPVPDDPGTYRIIDGIHRSIQMCRNGQEQIRLCVVGDP